MGLGEKAPEGAGGSKGHRLNLSDLVLRAQVRFCEPLLCLLLGEEGRAAEIKERILAGEQEFFSGLKKGKVHRGG